MKAIHYLTLLVVVMSKTKADVEIKHLENQKYVLTRTDDVLIFNEYAYLFHVTNLTKILIPYRQILEQRHNHTTQEMIWMKKIELLAAQLNAHKRYTRSLNFLGSALKFVTGNPDHDDLIKIETTINMLINNNEKQRMLNSRFERLIDSLQGRTLENNLIIEQVHDQLLLLVRTINAAKNNEYLTESLNIDDVKEIIQHELVSVPIINILEYADIYIAGTGDLVVTIYKYPLIIKDCRLFRITPISFRHGKIQTDEEIARCDKEYVRVNLCKNFLGRNICRTNNKTDTCILPLLNNRRSKCTIIQEYNDALLKIDEGFILLNGNHTVNNITTTGINLVTYTDQVTIDNNTYRNIQDRIIEAIHTKHDEDFEIARIIKSDRYNAFDNIDSLKRLFIPYEQHPIRSVFYTTLIVAIIFGTIFVGLKTFKYLLLNRQRQTEQSFRIYYNQQVERITRDRDDLV